MRKWVALLASVLAMVSGPAWARDITGIWQGTLHAGKDLRFVLKISKGDKKVGWNALIYSIDQSPEGIPVTSVTLHGKELKLSIDQIGSTYDGCIGADGTSIAGTWSQGKRPLDFKRATKKTAWVIDPSPHNVQFATVDNGVQLEVLDWGGNGRPLVFLSGLGETAHAFDNFAPKFTATHHVYGVTRRGFGASSKPDPIGANYTADRLGDDLLAVIDTLKLDKPILVGWSLGGEELSSVASRHPEKTSGLIYLDAAYAYGFYAPGNLVPMGSNLVIDANELRRNVDIVNGLDAAVPEKLAVINTLIDVSLPQLQTDLVATQKMLQLMSGPALMAPATMQSSLMKIITAINSGAQRFTELKVPILAIFATPQTLPPNMPAAVVDNLKLQDAASEALVERFEAGNPSAHVVRLANARHDLFNSNPDDVLREMNAFMATLP